MRESRGSWQRPNRYSVGSATRFIDQVTVSPPHGGGAASQCSNTRVMASHTRLWSDIRARIGRLCGHERESGGSWQRPNRYSVGSATRLIDRVTVSPPHGGGAASQCSSTRGIASHTRHCMYLSITTVPLTSLPALVPNAETIQRHWQKMLLRAHKQRPMTCQCDVAFAAALPPTAYRTWYLAPIAKHATNRKPYARVKLCHTGTRLRYLAVHKSSQPRFIRMHAI